MQDQRDESAVSSDAVRIGVPNDRRFETLAADIHNYGGVGSHDPATCTDLACGHSSHGLSTSGENLKTHQRAGDVYKDQGARQIRIRETRNFKTAKKGEIADFPGGLINETVAAGGDRAIEEIDHAACDEPKCSRCNRVDETTLRPEYSIQKGGSRSGRKPKSKRGGAALPPYIMTSYDNRPGTSSKKCDAAVTRYMEARSAA